MIKDFLNFELDMLNNPKTFFPMFEQGAKIRRDIIWEEFVNWQNNGGKIKDFDMKIVGEKKDFLYWRCGEDHYAEKIEPLMMPFSVEEYKNALKSVYSFLEDRPQYYKFRLREGMFNPLRTLLYEIIFPS